MKLLCLQFVSLNYSEFTFVFLCSFSASSTSTGFFSRSLWYQQWDSTSKSTSSRSTQTETFSLNVCWAQKRAIFFPSTVSWILTDDEGRTKTTTTLHRDCFGEREKREWKKYVFSSLCSVLLVSGQKKVFLSLFPLRCLGFSRSHSHVLCVARRVSEWVNI